MNNTPSNNSEDISKYLWIITKQYPHFYPEDITDIKEVKGKISFQYGGCFFICFDHETKGKTLFEKQFEFFEFMMSGFWWNKSFLPEVDGEMHFELLEKLKSNMVKYFDNMDISRIENIRFVNGYAIFNYGMKLFLCSIPHHPHMYLTWEYLDIWVDIYQTVEAYYPNVTGRFISDIQIHNGMMWFLYENQRYFCPLQAESEVIQQIQKIKQREDFVSQNTQKTKKRVLELIYSKSN